jgi:DtxR family Mn-dependent transcriptional regulator
MVVHIEDEPPDALRELLDAGLLPGVEIEARQREGGVITLRVGQSDCHLKSDLALYVHVRPTDAPAIREATLDTLDQLHVGDTCRIVALSDRCRGLTRRRLLDLGLTPGTLIGAELVNAGESATAYRVRDSLIVLRKEQAQEILIEDASVRSAC